MDSKKLSQERIMIFGGTGSLGKTLLKRYVKDNYLCVFSRDESKHWTIKNEMSVEGVEFIVGDIRDKERSLESILKFGST